MEPRSGKPAAVRFVRYRPAPPTRGALALRPATPPVPGPQLRLVRPGVDAEIQAVAEAAVRLVVEVLAGARPAHQLSLMAVPAVCRELIRYRDTTHSGQPAQAGRPARAKQTGQAGLPGQARQADRPGPAAQPARGGQVGRVAPPKVLSCRAQRPAAEVVETTAVVVVAGRVHALALRLEHARGRWRCTALVTTAR